MTFEKMKEIVEDILDFGGVELTEDYTVTEVTDYIEEMYDGEDFVENAKQWFRDTMRNFPEMFE